jgi:uncharacterized protein
MIGKEPPVIRLVATLVLVLTNAILPAKAQDAQFSIMAAPPGTTTSRIAADLAQVAGSCGISVVAADSKGSLENLLAINERTLTPLAIVQGDFLEYLRTFEPDDSKIAASIARVGVVAPLFAQEVHVVARKEIADLAGLAGKIVAIGEPESGSFLTARVVLDLLGVVPAKYDETAPASALEQLKAGEIDAVFLVDGAPSKILTDATLDPELFHLLKMDDEILVSSYRLSSIPAETYTFEPEHTVVVTIPSVLIGFDFNPTTRPGYIRSSCDTVAGVAAVLSQRKTDLVKIGHPKWNDLRLDKPVADWPTISCAEIGSAPDFELECTEQ